MSFQRIDSHLSSLISHLYLLLLLLLPLLFSMKSSEVFEFPKILFVYAMTTLITACWLARMIVNRKFIYTRTPLDIPIYFFLLSQLFSTFSSIDIHTSISGYYSRWNGGLLSTVAYTLLYFGYVNNISAEKGLALRSQGQAFRNVHRLIGYTVLASATIVSIYAILQRISIDRNLWVQDVVARVFSTQGQPNWLAAYLVMVIPVAWATGVTSDKLQVTSLQKYFWLVACSLLLVALFFTRSRSGLLGLAVADVVFWVLLFLKRSDLGVRQGPTFRGSSLRRPFLIVHCFLFIIFLITNNPAREFIAKRLFLQPSSFVLHPASADALDSSITPSSDIRRIVWTGALQLVKERPLFGWGPETFAFTYWRVRPVEHNMTSEWNFLYNKAHNEWLNLAANTGLFGLGTHLLLLGWFTVWSLHQLSRSSSSFSLWPSSFILATLSALLGAEATNFFGFSTVTTQTYSYIFMGIAVAEGRRQKEEGKRINGLRFAKNGLRIPFIVYCLLFIVSLSAIYLLSRLFFLFFADLSYSRGKQFANAGYIQDALADLESAVGLIPDEPVFRSELAETQGILAISLAAAAASSDSPDSPTPSTTLLSFKDSSLTNFRIVAKQSPVNVSFLRSRARITYALGALDSSLYDGGIELMERTVKLAPTDPKIPYNLGVMLLDRGETDEAKRSIEKSLELKPDYVEAREALSSANLTNEPN